ncbi:MAG TPA: filamentous hemagglutinin N-terminal domain-containing protein, partial [Bacteroidia bacterium]|nr:filamentous hemagglutinin N-terminal domain-containing protein [Bacteroidia bacterium]
MKASDGTPPSLLVRLRRQVRQSSAGSWRLAKSLRRPAFRATICTLLLPSLCLPLSTYANPSGGQVVAGAATISGSGSSLTITQGSHRAIINWQDFSIGAGQTTSFVQPSADSAALNRVLGGNPSAIHGQLNATGQVYLINPNGVLVGPGGVVNTAGFLASTLDVSDQDFLRGGDMTFKGASNAAVINLGSITAAEGDVILIARQVENHGDIDAPRGTVGLGAGSEVLLKAGGEERMFVRPDSGSSDASVNQAGKIRAATVELKAAGGNEYSLAIKHSGETRATGVSKRGGRVYLSAGGKGGIVNTGRITARKSSGRGGIVRVE